MGVFYTEKLVARHSRRGAGWDGGNMVTPQQLRDAALGYYRDKPVEFIEDNVKIEFVGREDGLIQPFKLWAAQIEAIWSILRCRLNVILKARQLGITWLVLALAVWKLLTVKGFRIGAISRSETEAKELVRRMRVMLDHMPQMVCDAKEAQPGWSGPTYTATATEITFDFKDGSPESTFKAFLSNPSAGRGFTFNWLILDEWAFHMDAETLYTSLFPTVNNGQSKVIGLSTIRRGSLYETIFTSPDNGYNKIFIPWHADPNRDDAWYKTTLGALGLEKTMQEYPATVEEALMVPGGRMFPEVRAESHVVPHDEEFWNGPVDRYACIDYGLDMFSCHWIAVNGKGKARVYREFNAPNLTIAAACDAYRSQLDEGEVIRQILAPGDLWNRDQVHGKSRALIFGDNGMTLTQSSRDFAAGVAAMKQWFALGEDGRPGMMFEENAAPNLMRCLQSILIDPKKPDVYAKQPHDLTHAPDALRYFCIYYVNPAEKQQEERKKRWTEDLLQDYERADEETRKKIEERYGKP